MSWNQALNDKKLVLDEWRKETNVLIFTSAIVLNQFPVHSSLTLKDAHQRFLFIEGLVGVDSGRCLCVCAARRFSIVEQVRKRWGRLHWWSGRSNCRGRGDYLPLHLILSPPTHPPILRTPFPIPSSTSPGARLCRRPVTHVRAGFRHLFAMHAGLTKQKGMRGTGIGGSSTWHAAKTVAACVSCLTRAPGARSYLWKRRKEGPTPRTSAAVETCLGFASHSTIAWWTLALL